MSLELILGLELPPRSAKSARKDDVARSRVSNVAPFDDVGEDPVNVLPGEAGAAEAAGVNLQVLGQGHETTSNELRSS